MEKHMMTNYVIDDKKNDDDDLHAPLEQPGEEGLPHQPSLRPPLLQAFSKQSHNFHQN